MTRTGHIVLKGSARMALPGGSGGTAELAFWGQSNQSTSPGSDLPQRLFVKGRLVCPENVREVLPTVHLSYRLAALRRGPAHKTQCSFRCGCRRCRVTRKPRVHGRVTRKPRVHGGAQGNIRVARPARGVHKLDFTDDQRFSTSIGLASHRWYYWMRDARALVGIRWVWRCIVPARRPDDVFGTHRVCCPNRCNVRWHGW